MAANNSDGGQQQKELYEATPVDDGPMAILRTRSGRLITGISLLIVALSVIGLAVGLSSNKRGGSSNTESNNQQQTQDIAGIRTGGDFCGATIPEVFYDHFRSKEFCSKEQLSKGGTLQQAVTNAFEQRAVTTAFDRMGSEKSLAIATNYCETDVTKLPEEDQKTFTTTCEHLNSTHFVLLHGGMVRGMIPANTTLTSKTYGKYVYFEEDSTMAVILLKKEDAIKVLNNAMDYVTQDDPMNIKHSVAYPYTGSLRYEVNLSAAPGQKVSNLRIFNPIKRDWMPANTVNLLGHFVIVTNRWIAEGNGGYLDEIEPMYLDITSLNYEDEIVGILEQMEGDYWMPPTLDEMSTTAFHG